MLSIKFSIDGNVSEELVALGSNFWVPDEAEDIWVNGEQICLSKDYRRSSPGRTSETEVLLYSGNYYAVLECSNTRRELVILDGQLQWDYGAASGYEREYYLVDGLFSPHRFHNVKKFIFTDEGRYRTFEAEGQRLVIDMTGHPAYEASQVKGTWLHVFNSTLPEDIEGFAQIKGEICVSDPADGEYLSNREGYIAALFTGTVNHLYHHDCWSETVEVDGIRFRVPGTTTGEARSEGFLVPNDARFDGFVVGNESTAKFVEARYPGYRVTVISNFSRFEKLNLDDWMPEMAIVKRHGVKVVKLDPMRMLYGQRVGIWEITWDTCNPGQVAAMEHLLAALEE